jgi:hypothetical protein
VDRLAVDGKQTISAAMKDTKVKALHQVEVRDAQGTISLATVEVKCRRLQVFPLIGKQKKYPSLRLTVIHARERVVPSGRPPIDWKLITNLPVRSPAEALEKLSWYAMRWKIETFHKILKSGCRAEASKLRAAEGRENREPDRGLLYPQLADLLDNDDEPRCSDCDAYHCVDKGRDQAFSTCYFRTAPATRDIPSRSPATSPGSPGWVAIWRGPRILRQEMPSCGAACRG